MAAETHAVAQPRATVRILAAPAVSLQRLLLHAIAIVMCAVMIFPLLWMLSTAFKGPTEIFTEAPRLIPLQPTLANFVAAFADKPVLSWIRNTVLIAVATTLLRLLIALPAAYAFARLRFPHKGALLGIIIGTMIIPGVVTLIPNYLLIVRLGWINALPGVVVPMAASSAFFIFLFRQHMLQIPVDLYDAAELDGASHPRMLRDITVPLMLPAIGAMVALSFLWSWNAYLWPLLVLPTLEAQTLAVGLGSYAGDPDGVQLWGPLMSVALLSSLPPLVLFVAAQKLLTAALTSGLKG